MDQRIFNMGLTVEATSLYLLMVSLSDGGTVLTRGNMEPFWNGSPEDLTSALEELQRRKVLEAGREDYALLPAGHWLMPPDPAGPAAI